MVPHVTMTTTTSMSPIDHMCNISHTDCLVLFSFPRYSSQDEVTAEMAHDAGASIIVITDKPSSLLAKYADILLTVPVDSNTFFNSMIGPQFVTEALLEIISHRAKGIEIYLFFHKLFFVSIFLPVSFSFSFARNNTGSDTTVSLPMQADS